MLAYLLTGLSLGLSAAITPGPFQAFLLSQSIRNGWQKTLPASLAPLFSDGPIIALVLLVLTQTPDWFLNLLRIGGGLFILYLAKDAFKLFQSGLVLAAESAPVSGSQSLLKAIVMNGLNPNPYIFWSIAAGPILLKGWRQSPQLGLSFVAGFYGMLIGGFALFIVVFATAGKLDVKIARLLTGVSALALLVFGLYQLWQGVWLWV